MIIKYSLKSIIRTPKKTLLFLFLLTALTIFISIGAGMYESACNMFADADKTFTSVVELDYLGDIGGDEAGFYKNMNLELADFNFDKLKNNPNVKAVDMEKSAWAFIEGNSVNRTDSPLYNYVMVKVSGISLYQNNLYMGVVDENLFGKRVRTDAYIMIGNMDEQGNIMNYDFKADHEYLIIGKSTNEKTPTLIITPGIPEPAENIPPITDLTENPDFLSSEAGLRVLDLKEAMKVVDDSLMVTTVSSLEASAPYYFNDMLLKEGRFFKPAEYEEGNNKVILISEAVADCYQAKPGDKMSLRLHYNSSGIGLSDFLTDNKFDYEADYLVAGILKNRSDYKYIIYMPEAGWIKQELHSPLLARYMVNNGSGEKFIKNNKKNLLPNMEFTLYDQGYGEAVKPIAALRNNAVLIIILAALSGIVILLLYSYLFVIKQKDTLKTMLSLGSGKRRTRGYILIGSAALVLTASSIGAVISSCFLNKLTVNIFEAMQENYAADVRYSERSLGLQLDFVPQVRLNPWLPAFVIIIILIFSMIFLLLYTNSILREDAQATVRKVRKPAAAHVPQKIRARKMLFGRVRPVTLKFALISLTRSPGRSSIIPFISLILSVFIVFLGLLSKAQQEKLATVYDRIPVTAYMTTPRNETREIGGLNLYKDIYRLIDPEYPYQDREKAYTMGNASIMAQEERNRILSNSKYFDEMMLYSSLYYEYMGISMTKDGKVNEELASVPDIRNHNNDYGFDWFINKMKQMPKLVYADDLRYTPDFFDRPEPEAEFMEGYGFDSLRRDESICIIPKNFAEANGIEMGDTIRITGWLKIREAAACSVINLKVAGIYDTSWKTDTIYLPWIMGYDHNYFFDFEYPSGGNAIVRFDLSEAVPRNVKAATFALKNTKDLAAFRDYLESEGYSRVGKAGSNRRVIVIQDKRLADTVQSLKNHIRLLDTIKPVMLLLFGIIGFTVSYLLIKHRMNELGIMRSMGAKKRQVFLSYFLEQMILFIIGLIPAIIYTAIWPDKLLLYGASLVYFILCYLAGTALALMVMNRAKILEVLFTKE